MENIKYILEKYKKIIIIVLIILFILIGLIVSFFSKTKDEIEYTEYENIIDIEKKLESNNEEEKKVKVDIKGFIKNPGVYELSSESRVLDVINAAGGLLENANTEYLNLSRKLTDEMVIIIYSNDEINQLDEENSKLENSANIDKDNIVNNISSSDSTETNSSSKTENVISLNTGTISELMTLKGIGESKAKLIIEYREINGGFKSIEELKNIKGIGESTYSKIKEYIKL